MGRSHKLLGAGRAAWGGALLLGAATVMVPWSLPYLPGVHWVHEAPVVTAGNPDRRSAAPLEQAPVALGEPRGGATLVPLVLRLAETLTDPDDTRAAAPGLRQLWVATGGGLLEVPYEAPEQARWWTTADGLPDHRLTAIALQGDRLAVGTEGGAVLLLDVDALGRGQISVLASHQLAPSRVSDLLFADGALYASTWGAGVFRSTGDGFEAVGPERGLRARQVTSLAWQDGELLAGTAGAGLWVKSTGGARRYVARGGLAGDFVLDLASVRGSTWIATPEGLSRYRGGGLQTWRAGDELPPGLLRVVGGDPREGGGVRLGLAGGRLGTFGEPDAAPLPSCPDGLRPEHGVPGPDVRWVVQGGDGIWVGTDRGIVLEEVAAAGSRRRWLTHGGTGSNDLTSVSARGGRLAAGTFDRGAWVGRLGDGAIGPRWSAVPLPSGQINDLLIDADGTAWFATSAGLAAWDGFTVRRFGAVHGLHSEHVSSVAMADRGLWVGTTAGVQRFDGGGFGPAYGDGSVSHVCDVAADGEGVWAGTLHGLWRLRRSSGTRFRYETGELPDNWVNAVVATGDEVWAGTYDRGLARWDGGWAHVTQELPDGWVNPGAMAALPDGSVLVGTMGGGLFRVSGDRVLDRWTASEGLAGDDVTGVAVDGSSIWIATRSGLSRLEVSDAEQS